MKLQTLNELMNRGVPIIVDTAGYIPLAGAFVWRVSGKVPPKKVDFILGFDGGFSWSPMKLSHELQHVRDYLTDTKPYLEV